MISSEKPYNLGKINLSISITVGLVGLLISCVFTCLFYSSTEDQKKTLNFLTTILETSAGVTSAFYIGQNIRLNAESKKLDRTTSYISRWNDTAFDSARRAAYQIHEMLDGRRINEHSIIIQEALDNDLDLKLGVLDALNFLEEMSLCVSLGIIDEKTTYQFYRSIVQAYCTTFNLWIIKLRNDKENPTLFKSFTDLCEKWKNGN